MIRYVIYVLHFMWDKYHLFTGRFSVTGALCWRHWMCVSLFVFVSWLDAGSEFWTGLLLLLDVVAVWPSCCWWCCGAWSSCWCPRCWSGWGAWSAGHLSRGSRSCHPPLHKYSPPRNHSWNRIISIIFICTDCLISFLKIIWISSCS